MQIMNWLSPLVKKRISLWLLINWFFSSLVLPLYMPLAQAAERNKTVQPYNDQGSNSSRNALLLPSLGSDATRREVPNTVPDHEDSNAQFWQGNFNNLWGVMSSPDSKREVRDFAASKVTGMANKMAEDAVRDWLSQKGNARLSFTSQGKGSADVLVPAWDTQNHLIFWQGGFRLDKERNIWNTGLGWRYYPSEQWMLGANSFYDYDQTGGNARWGAGIEARTEYLSLSANRYFRLTDWQQSPLKAMRDYDERPANGYDVRGKYWLPSFPKLGGELAYEKYFGKRVSMKGDPSADSLRDAPYALTGTVNYTPFPLITMSVGHKSGSISETIAKLEFNYRLGQPLSVQANGENVKLMRSLAGSRYDFVDRNYNIVMQYRKQPLVSLTLPAELSAGGRATIRINATAWAKYGIKDIDWQSSDLLASGGEISRTSLTQVKVKLPAWKAGGNNTYRLTAVMTDKEGNRTEPAEMMLHVEQNTAQIGSGDLVVNKETAVANGADTVTYTALVKDANGNPVEDQEVTWQSTLGNLGAYSSVTDKNGKTTITLTSTVVGSAQVSASVNGKPGVNAPKVAFTADAKTAQVGNLSVDNSSILANNTDKATFTLVLKDANGNLVANHPVSWSTDRGNLSASSSRTNDKGEAVIVLTGSQVGVAQVSASVNGNPGVKAPEVRLTADNATARIQSGDLKVDKTKVIANNTEKATYTARVTDAAGHPLENYKVSWVTDKGTLGAADSITDADGKAHVELHDTKKGKAVVTATVRGNGTKAHPVMFTVDMDKVKVAVVSEKKKITGTGVETTTLTATVTDADGDLVSGVPLIWTSSLGAVAGKGDTDANGQATATLTAPVHVATTNGTATVKVGGSTGTGGSTDVTVRAVMKAGTRYYWTMRDLGAAATEATANTNCKNFGGGQAASWKDLVSFAAAGTNFKDMSVKNEFIDDWYDLAGSWKTKSGDFSTQSGAAGDRVGRPGGAGSGHYVCVK